MSKRTREERIAHRNRAHPAHDVVEVPEGRVFEGVEMPGWRLEFPAGTLARAAEALHVIEDDDAGVYIGEHAVDLALWRGDGLRVTADGDIDLENHGNLSLIAPDGTATPPKNGRPWLSIGRADSQEALGFMVHIAKGAQVCGFVLSPDQVKTLRDHLTFQLGRLKAPRRSRARAA